MRHLALTIILLGLYLFIGISQANADEVPGLCKFGCRYSFNLAGKIENIPLTSPLAQFNGADYTAAGYFTNSGALNITQLKIDSDPGSCTTGCVADIVPGACATGCLTAVNDGGKFTVSLKLSLNGTFATIPNISTQPTIKLVFPDPTGTMTLADLPSILPQLEAIQFPTLGLSTTGLSETWAPSVSTFQLGLINADVPPGGCPYGCKYSFSLNGKIQGIPLASPLAMYNGKGYSASGEFFDNGVLSSAQFKAEVDPGSCAGGCINADLEPTGCKGGGCLVGEEWPPGCASGCKFDITLNPALLFSHATLGTVNIMPVFKFTFDNPTGTMALNNLQSSLTKLEAVTFPSLGLNASGISETWTPTVTTYSLLLATPPPTSTITAPLNNAPLKGISTKITGTADDADGPGLQQVEVGITPSGGTTTWHLATDTSGSGNWSTWSYAWFLTQAGGFTIQSRATDSAGNVETPATGVAVTVVPPVVNETLTFNAGTGGSILGTTSQNVSSVGSSTPVMAVAALGYSFVNWTGENGFVASTANPLTVTNPTASYNITANFTGVPVLTSTVTAKNGAQNARVWTITLANTGTATALNAGIIGFALTQTFGAACTPVITNILPINLGNIPQGSSASRNLTIDFTGCASTAKFSAKTTFSANSGSISGSNTLNNQFR